MNDGGFLYIGPLYDLVFNILVVLYRLSGENLGIALIALALLSRIVMIPFTRKQLKNVDKNKEFQAKYQEIKKKYKNKKKGIHENIENQYFYTFFSILKIRKN